MVVVRYGIRVLLLVRRGMLLGLVWLLRVWLGLMVLVGRVRVTWDK